MSPDPGRAGPKAGPGAVWGQCAKDWDGACTGRSQVIPTQHLPAARQPRLLQTSAQVILQPQRLGRGPTQKFLQGSDGTAARGKPPQFRLPLQLA